MGDAVQIFEFQFSPGDFKTVNVRPVHIQYLTESGLACYKMEWQYYLRFCCCNKQRK
jgi:hypothetical protein